MDIELDPPNGITGFPLGMPAEAVKEAAAALGRVKVQDDGSASRFSYMKVTALHPQFEIVLHLEDGRTLTAAEVWNPRPGPGDVTVRFRGVDVFRTPALRLVEQLEATGLTVLHGEPGYWTVPGLSLGLARVAGHEVPLDTDGRPLYFQAVLTAPADYYDHLTA
ncbi:hypothetical protein LO771_21165 [Streptacidiphilus sp. ASG 303]|uniref:hypothetical protein n=1 Tax=Streptacidiphilus sp. ASG 303 TaxID=2896847 RepID=UPI001E5AB261|nr:hypothetical protein [Streptacidiphilus sp. ASG 303]MCD0484833.1 hypothetical protein [Streptacidiphilus sp. ASG 303]